MDSGLPNIIDSLLINLDNLQLGADFTEEMTFTGFHNISHMIMSFRVECSPGFCGHGCSTTLQNNPLVATCQADGTITCNDKRFNPSPLVASNDCLYNVDTSKSCSTCLLKFYDPAANCTHCLPGWDITSDCTSCLPGGDTARLCQTCMDSFNPNATECVANYDLSTTSCLPGIIGGVVRAVFIILLATIVVILLRRRGKNDSKVSGKVNFNLCMAHQ